MRFFNNMVFWKKLMIVSVVPLLIISIVIGTLSYHRASLAAQESSKNNISDAVNRIDITLTLRTRQMDKAMQTIANTITLSQTDEQIDSDELLQLCENMAEPFQEVKSISVFRGESLLCCTEEDVEPDREMVSGMYAQVESFPQKTIWSGVSKYVFLEHQQSSGSAILVYRGLRDDSGETVGMIVLELDANSTGSTILLKQKIIDDQISFLVDEKKALIYCDTVFPEGLVQKAMDQYRSGRRMFAFTLDGEDYFCCAQYNGMVGWITFTAISWDALFPGADSLRNYIIMLVAVCVLIASVLLLILSRLITKPLAKLSEGMKQVQSSNFEVRLENDRSDEIGELTDSFNFMVGQIRTLINRVYREQLAQKSAEMEALQAQINPHFLYNSLDSINWMLIERGEMEISSVVVALGKLMQYSMDTRKSLVPLREEYRNARDYLVVQHNRLEDQLDYQLELEPGLEEFHIPKLILQPLIENAIKHGVLESMHRCLVTVRTCRQGDQICITVSDSGAGMNEERLQAYRQLLSGKQEAQNNIGIRNVARRLQLHFNEQCEFHVESTPGDGTSVSLLLPVIEKGEDPE